MAQLTPRLLLHRYELPQKVQITKGHYGKREEDSLSEGDVITAFYAKKESIVIATNRNNRRVVIPLKSPMSFWLLLDTGALKDTDPIPDYSKTFLIEDIVSRISLPVNVRAIDDASELTASSAWSLTLHAVEVQETLYAGNARMDELMSIPLDLDIEFELVCEPTAPPKPRREENPYEYISDPFFESLLEANQVRGVGSVWLSAHTDATFTSSNKSLSKKRSISLPRVASRSELDPHELFPEGVYLEPTPLLQLDEEVAPAPPLRNMSVSRSASVSKASRAALSALSVQEVCATLGKMNLAQYKQAFEEQQIDGSLLIELDDDMLEELGVTSKLHRLRIKNLIAEGHP